MEKEGWAEFIEKYSKRNSNVNRGSLKGYVKKTFPEQEANDIQDIIDTYLKGDETGQERGDNPGPEIDGQEQQDGGDYQNPGKDGPEGDFPTEDRHMGGDGLEGDGPITDGPLEGDEPEGDFPTEDGHRGGDYPVLKGKLPKEFDNPDSPVKKGKDLEKAIEKSRELAEEEKRKDRRTDLIYVPEWNREKKAYEYDKVGYKVKDYDGDSTEEGFGIFNKKFKRLSDLVSDELKKLSHVAKRIAVRQTEGALNMRDAVREIKRGLAGKEMSDKIYDRSVKKRRDYVVSVLIDRSGSTRNDVSGEFERIDIEKYSAMVLGDALDAVGDSFGVYSFTTNDDGNETYIEILKDFDDEWDEKSRKTVAGIRPGDQNHDGSVIRGMAELLGKRSEKKKIIVYLSDGSPRVDDGYYQEDYGEEDTLKAVEEAEKAGIKMIYLTIDPKEMEFFKQISEKCSFAEKYKDVFELPKRITDLYLTIRK